MRATEKAARRIFAERAARYTTSATHADPQVLARVVARIRALLDGLDDGQRSALNLRDVDGEPHLDHWYVVVSATVP